MYMGSSYKDQYLHKRTSFISWMQFVSYPITWHMAVGWLILIEAEWRIYASVT